MKNFLSVTKLMSIAMLMVVAVGCDGTPFSGGSASESAGGDPLPVEPLAGTWTIGLANTDIFLAESAESDVEPRSIDHGLGNIVELLQLSFDETAGTVTITSTECEISRTFDLFLEEECDEECPGHSEEDDDGIHAEIEGDWGPIESCDSEGTESGTFWAGFYIELDSGKISGNFESSVTVTTEGDVTTYRSGRLIGARDGLPASPPDPTLVNGTWTADVEADILANFGESVDFDFIDFYVEVEFDQNGGVLITLAGEEEICLPGIDFNYVFHLDMDGLDDFEKDGHGCIAGAFDIEDTCESGFNLRGVLIAEFELRGCEFDEGESGGEEIGGFFELMLVGGEVEGPIDFSAVLRGEFKARRERPEVANESTLVGDWHIHFDDVANEDSFTETVWFDLNDMLSEFSDVPGSCSNLVSFPYTFDGEDAEPQYTVMGGWDLVNTCDGDQIDRGTQTLLFDYDADTDEISGIFAFEESGIDSEGDLFIDNGSGTLWGHRVTCLDD